VIDDDVQVQTDLPVPDPGMQVSFKILQRLMIRNEAMTASQVLIQWDRQPESLVTWEDAEALIQHFPAGAYLG
jgi:hypothetical protein